MAHRHLTPTEITSLVQRFRNGETKAELARAFEINHATVIYHLRRAENSYPEDESVYAILKIQQRKSCLHPSSRCTTCGTMWDQLHRAEREQVERLTIALAKANDTLRTAGYVVESR